MILLGMWSKPLFIATVAFGLIGCADAPQPHARAAPATTSAGAIRLADAQPLDDLQSDQVQITLTDRLDSPAVKETIYFGEADEYDSDDASDPVAALPLIATHDGVWKAVPLVDAALVDAGWKYVGAGPALHEVWGVLDTSAGESRGEFIIAHSTDGGATFALKVFQKPCRLAGVADFAMSRQGHGRVTLWLDIDCGRNKAGLYHYDTADDGKTWSMNPRYEPDAMIRADSVPDDEQPDDAKSPARTILHRGRARVHVAPRMAGSVTARGR